MKKIKILRANWKCKDTLLKENINVTTNVIKQGKIIVDPSDDDFISALIKIYAKTKKKNTTYNLKIDHAQLFYYGENSLAYMLNLIYMDLFKTDDQPFEPLLRCDNGDVYSIGLFSIETKPIENIIKIMKKLDVDLKYIIKKHMVSPFPRSLDDYDNDKLFDFSYSKISTRKKSL